MVQQPQGQLRVELLEAGVLLPVLEVLVRPPLVLLLLLVAHPLQALPRLLELLPWVQDRHPLLEQGERLQRAQVLLVLLVLPGSHPRFRQSGRRYASCR